MKGCPWQDLHPHWTASEAVVSALDYMGFCANHWLDDFALRTVMKNGSPSRICPGTASFTTRNATVTLWRELNGAWPNDVSHRHA